MSKADLMKSYVPDYLKEAQSYKVILEAEGPELDAIETNLADVLKQFYVETATEEGLSRWEEFVGLSSYAGKPLDQRRSRIISKLRGMGTVTVNLIKNVAESYVYGAVEVLENPAQYSFTIRFIDARGIPPNLDDIKMAIEEIKPAHLAVIYEFRYLIWDELDSRAITWDELDALNLPWDEFETGGWLNA